MEQLGLSVLVGMEDVQPLWTTVSQFLMRETYAHPMAQRDHS